MRFPRFPKRREDTFGGLTRHQKRDLDKLCREVVFRRDGDRCLRCGSTRQLQWSHVYSRRQLSLRWDPDNSFCACAGCHLWWHKKPMDAAQWFRWKVGDAKADSLMLRANTPGKAPHFEVMKAWLESLLRDHFV